MRISDALKKIQKAGGWPTILPKVYPAGDAVFEFGAVFYEMYAEIFSETPPKFITIPRAYFDKQICEED